MADILVYVLHNGDAFNKNSLGAVSEAAARAAEIGGSAHAAVLGGEELTDEMVAGLGAYGASKVFRTRGTAGLAAPVVDFLDTVIAAHGQRYAIFGGGLLGFEIAGGLAARRNAGLTSEVVEVQAQDGELVAHRPILADSQISVSRYRGNLGIIIGRINAFEAKRSGAGAAEIVDIEVEYQPFSNAAQLISRGEQRGAAVDIEGADVLVAVGRGFGSGDNLAMADELAGAFGGNSAVAATRAVVDAGWAPYASQIGQTGKTVAPKLYLAAGISGAIQHKVGMQSSENIVAINKDANAPIFEFSDLGVVGDLNKILPKLTDAIKAKKG
ncbi:MAG TPA: electron transfer flavoprotein subunit alpha/FixB family protein [Solirubrobacteraceae bacterium]|nr:electron transfer flavoprotein subunit alpha/FixB family protein [Solirubrobacteraceae bacterium]